MKTPIYNVYDGLVKVWGQPNFQYRNDADAVRGFAMAANKPGSQISEFAENFSFHKIGEWDDETGEFSLITPPTSLGRAVDYKKQLAPSLQAVENN